MGLDHPRKAFKIAEVPGEDEGNATWEVEEGDDDSRLQPQGQLHTGG